LHPCFRGSGATVGKSAIGNRKSDADDRFRIADSRREGGVSEGYAKPLPKPSELTRPFWDGLREGELRLQKCADCGEFVFYPRPECNYCMSARLEWTAVSGRGTVYTFTIVRRANIPAFQADVPYVFAIVELDEGPRLATNIVGCEPRAVRVDMPVKAAYDDVTEEISLLKFEPA